jgi:hypothetical protein
MTKNLIMDCYSLIRDSGIVWRFCI